MKKALKILMWSVLGMIIIPFIAFFYLYLSADMGEPQLTVDTSDYPVSVKGDTIVCDDSYLRYDSCGVWELYIKGSDQHRGAKQGALTKDLMRFQEDVFVNQIKEIIPSDGYLKFLRGFIVVFNRNLGQYIPLEYRNEIAAMSMFCTNDYNAIGTPYERQLNYHAAHDIGHTMQQYMLVGCSSFGVWGSQSESGSMIIARNFDFYVGDEFAQNKLITFAAPDKGYRYASIGWAGMIGVLSGMNQCGLTVTINAAKGAIPGSAATPISILTREILQYASTIEQAYIIASSRHTFVSESILVGSINDGKAALIEKTPKHTALYSPSGERLVSTNHFQSDQLSKDEYNIENISNSDSKYRYDRLEELLTQNPSLNHTKAIDILRDRFGKGGTDIGVSNEMTINQSIAHHSLVFMPKEKLMWISTSPWQSGQVVCYDLKGFFEGTSYPRRDYALDVALDSVFMDRDYTRLINYRKGLKEIKKAINDEKGLEETYIEDFKSLNSNNYNTYRVLGDYFASRGSKSKAVEMYKLALNHEIPYKDQRTDIEILIDRLNK